METDEDRNRPNITMPYLYRLAEECVLDLLYCAEDKNQYALALDLVIMNTVLMNRTGVQQIGHPITIYHNQWNEDVFHINDTVCIAARTRLYIAQEYIRQLVSHGEPILTVPDRIHALFDGSKPRVMPGSRHVT